MTELKDDKKSLEFIQIEDGKMMIIRNSETKYEIGNIFWIEREGKTRKYEVIGYEKNGYPLVLRL